MKAISALLCFDTKNPLRITVKETHERLSKSPPKVGKRVHGKFSAHKALKNHMIEEKKTREGWSSPETGMIESKKFTIVPLMRKISISSCNEKRKRETDRDLYEYELSRTCSLLFLKHKRSKQYDKCKDTEENG